MDASLFGESQSRIVLSVSSAKLEELKKQLTAIPFTVLGKVQSGKAMINDTDFGSILSLKEFHQTSIEKQMTN